MGGGILVIQNLSENLKGRIHLGDLGIDEMVVLKLIFV